jgi:hypothetical protein
MLGLLLLTGCQTNRDDRDEARGGPTLVYERARDALDRQDPLAALRAQLPAVRDRECYWDACKQVELEPMQGFSFGKD